MLKGFLFIAIFVFGGITATAQFDVSLKISANDPFLERDVENAVRIEFGKIKDVKLAEKGKFGLLIELIKRPVGKDIFDVFISTVSTSGAVCIVRAKRKRKVFSRQSCKEFLTANSYVGRSNELLEITEQIVREFDGFVLEPLRGIEQ